MNIVYLFEAFITWCGITHFIAIWRNHPLIVMTAAKIVTAIVSLCTSVLLIRIMPKALSIPFQIVTLEEELGLRMRNEQNLQIENDNLIKLRRITQSIRRTLDFQTICKSACLEFSQTMIGVDTVAMYISRDGESFEMVTQCHSTYSASTTDILDTTIPLDIPVVNRSSNHGFPVNLTTVELRSILPMSKYQSAVAILLEFNSSKGVILLCSNTYGWTLQDQDNELLEDCAGQIQIALQQAIQIETETMRLEQLAQQYRRNALLEKAKQEAEALAKMKTEFLATISHELRTPMNAIIGFVDLLLRSDLTPDQRETLEIVQQSSGTLLNLLNNLLDVTKLEFYGHQFQLDDSKFSVRDVIEHVTDLLNTAAEKREIHLNYFVDQNVPEYVMGDKTRLRQVLVNFLSNAIKFTESGEVYIAVSAKEIPIAPASKYPTFRFLDFNNSTGETVHPDLVSPFSETSITPTNPEPGTSPWNGTAGSDPKSRPPKMARNNSNSDDYQTFYFQIVDTGIGIPEDAMFSLFQKFRQVDSSFSRRFQGTGLGLAISAKLIELHRGKIWVQSQKGVGSVFTFTLKFKKYVNPSPPVSQPPLLMDGVPNGDPLNAVVPATKDVVLIIDEWPTTRKAISLLLESCHAKGLPFDSCGSALRHVRENNISPVAVIVDETTVARLPDDVSSAYELAKSSAFIVITRPIKYSHSLSPSTLQKIFEPRYYQHTLHKPIKRSTISRVLREAIVAQMTQNHSRLSQILNPDGSFSSTESSPTYLAGYSSILAALANQTDKSSEEENKTKEDNLLDALRPLRILIVDDNPINRKVAVKLLNHLGFKNLDTAVNGLEAVQMIQEHPDIKIVFMDISMPICDGLSATRKIQTELSRSPPWIIAMTASAMMEERKMCFENGMNDFLPKPVNRNDLFEVLKRYVDSPVNPHGNSVLNGKTVAALLD
ncbi:hypothetical protein BKA69DRAFT_239319 [Paraphysoderma sedebokerense]|nr:hypothetical protein BKA69DRAFT_239319 [Paraphysoderma sedebokerense]